MDIIFLVIIVVILIIAVEMDGRRNKQIERLKELLLKSPRNFDNDFQQQYIARQCLIAAEMEE